MKYVLCISFCYLIAMAGIIPAQGQGQTRPQTQPERIPRTGESPNRPPPAEPAPVMEPQVGFFGMSFAVTNPQGDFREKLDELGTPRVGYGFSLQGGWMPENLPLAIGMQGDFIFMGGQERYFRSGTGGIFRDTVSTQTTFIPITAFVRLQPNLLGFVFPYAEGFFGLNVINSSSTIRTNVQLRGFEPQGQSFSSAPFVYGYGAGVMIKFLDIIAGDEDKTTFLLDIKMRYTQGATTTYRIIQGIDDNGFVTTESARSGTDMVNFTAGITIRF